MGLWMAGLTVEPATPRPSQQQGPGYDAMARIKELEHHIGRLSLMNQALWEILREKLNLSDKELMHMAHEIDIRDGVEDGAITNTPLRCPSCGRVSNSKHWKCMYCGQRFEKPIMG